MAPALEAQVSILASLITRLATVRDVSAANLPVHLRSAMTNVSSLAEELASSNVQETLAAAELEHGIGVIDLQNSRRELRRQSDQVDVTPPAKQPIARRQLYPPNQPNTILARSTLPDAVEKFNRANRDVNLSIWTQTNPSTQQANALRILIPGILVGYINLRDQNSDDSLIPGSVSVTGIREQRTSSEFIVFRLITQHIFQLMVENKDVTAFDLASLLVSYRDLYSQACEKCHRVYSSQDGVPAIIRFWIETDQAQWTRWCLHESCTTT